VTGNGGSIADMRFKGSIFAGIVRAEF